MKKIGIAFGIVAAVLLLALAAIWVLANPNRNRELIQAQLEKQIGRKVTLGEMSLGLLPLRFQVQNPVIGEDPGIGQQPFIRAGKLDLQIGLLPLLRGTVRVDSLELNRPSVELVKTREGVWNFSTLGAGPGDAANAPVGSRSASGTSAEEFSLHRLKITDGQIGVTDMQQGRPRAGYDHIDLTLLDYQAGRPFSFDLAAHIQGNGAQEARLKGEGGPLLPGNPLDTPFRGTIHLNQIGIESLLQFLDTKAVNAKGVLSGESEIASQSGIISTKGRLKLDAAQFNNLEVGYPIALDYKLDANIADGLVNIEGGTLQLGQTPLLITGTLSTASAPPILDLKIKSGDVSIAEIARMAAAFGVAFAPGTSVSGRVSADLAAKGPVTKPVLTGTIAGRDLQISGQGIAQPVQVKAIELALSPTAIQSNEFNATTGKTAVVGQFSLLQYASNSPSIDLGLRTPGATLPEIQSIAKAYGVTGLDQITGNGTLNFDLRARGPLQSLSTADATRALNGTINLDFSPLKIAGFDTAHELGKLGGFASNLTEQGATDIVKVVGRILVKNGIAQTDDLRVQLGIGNLSASGSADLSAESLNLKLAAVFSKAFNEKAANTRTGGFLNTAFSNSNGELVLPAIVTGTFKQPKFAPDLKAVAELQRQKYLPTLDNPGAAISNVLGLLTGKKKDAQEQPPAEQKRTGLKGLLDALGGKK